MQGCHREAIRRVFADLAQRLVVDKEFIIHFRTNDVLTSHMAEEILVGRTSLERSYKFLDTITKRGPTAFESLILALNSTGQSHLAELIDTTGEFAHIKPKPSQVYPPDRLTPTAPPMPTGQCGQSQSTPGSVTFENMKQIPMSPVFLKTLKTNPEKVGAYKVNDRTRGRAVIIANENFTGMKARQGSEWDVQNLDQLLQYFNYDTFILQDLTADQIRQRVQREAGKEDHKEADSFIMVCLSHGNQGNIFGTDVKPVSIDKDIVESFDGKHCPALLEKPKLFFIQACQGDTDTCGSTRADGEIPEEAGGTMAAMDQLKIVDKPDAVVFDPQPSHEKADIFKFYATVPGYRAWRNTAQGSWFIHDLVKAICENSHNMDLGRIAIKVNNEINKRQTTNKGFKQMSQMHSTLTKEFYFAK